MTHNDFLLACLRQDYTWHCLRAHFQGFRPLSKARFLRIAG